MNWYYTNDGESQKGPVTEEELVQAIKEKKISKQALVWNEKLDDWKDITEIETLAKHFEVKPPPLPKKRNHDSSEQTTISSKGVSDRSYSDETHDFHSKTSLNKNDKDFDCPYCDRSIYLSEPNKVNKKVLCKSCSTWIDLDEENKPVENRTDNKNEVKSGYVYDSKENGTPLRWFNFYTYIRIPGIILFSLINAFNPPSYTSPQEAEFLMIFGTFIAIIYSILFFGLYNRKLWGWKMNWFILTLEIILVPIASYNDINSSIIIGLIAGILFYGIPNYIYFNKRKHLFD